ncbi:MAG TPA: pseudouridine synthase [Longimicrobium sp.]|nr:pseudouridine synthase [Longimicrobium sp.]
MARQHSPRPERHPHHGEPVRLQAFLARSGVSSRRAAEELIAAGRVWVNGETVTAPGTRVVPGHDRVEVDGEEVHVAPVTWLALHKPKGYVTTRDDPYGRLTVYELIPERFHGLFHVGRLDRDSEGLLLLTNDGETANRLLHPSHGITKEYEVDAQGRLTNEDIHQLQDGVELEDGMARAESVKLLSPLAGGMFRARMVLREGKKREVRRMMEAVGHKVVRLVRKRFGPIELAELPEGKWRVLSEAELKSAFEPGHKQKASGDEHAEDRPKRKTPPAKPHGKYSHAAEGAADRPKPRAGAAGAGGDVDRPKKPHGKYSRAAGDARPGAKPRRGGGDEDRPARTFRPFRDDDAGERRPSRGARPHREDAGERRPPRAKRPFRDDDAHERRPAHAARGRPVRDAEARDETPRAPGPRDRHGGHGRPGPRGRGPARGPRPGINDRPFFRKDEESGERRPARGPGARPPRRDHDEDDRGPRPTRGAGGRPPRRDHDEDDRGPRPTRGAGGRPPRRDHDDEPPRRPSQRRDEERDEDFRPRGGGPKRGGPGKGKPFAKREEGGAREHGEGHGRRPGQRRHEEHASADPRRRGDAPPRRGGFTRGPASRDEGGEREGGDRKPGFSPWGRPGKGGKPGGGGPRKPGGGPHKPGKGGGRKPGGGGPRGR